MIFQNTSNKSKARKSSACFDSYHISILNKKDILIQNEKDIQCMYVDHCRYTVICQFSYKYTFKSLKFGNDRKGYSI